MSYRGVHNGMHVYDYLEEVPGPIAESGQKFIVLYPPEELKTTGSIIAKKTNSLSIAAMIFIGACMIIFFVGTVYVLQQLGYVLQGRPGQKVDENLFEGGDGSVWVRDPETGEWTMEKGPRFDVIIWAVVAIAIIAVAIIVFLNLRKKGGKKDETQNPGKSKKEG